MRLPTYEDLSVEQDSILFSASYDGRTLITGPPGTGKTVIAIYRAITALAQERKVTVVMYNNVLKSYTRDNLEEYVLSKDISTWHSWFSSWYRKAFHAMPPRMPGSRWDYNWTEIIQKVASTTGSERLKKISWGHLVIDEGQDFPDGFYRMANLVVHMTGDRNVFGKFASGITVAADDNQRLNETQNSTVAEIKTALTIDDDHHYRLTKNYRNTRPIAEVAKYFYTGLASGIPELPDVEGDLPSMIESDRLYETVDFIKRYARTNDHHTIGIFTPTKRLQGSIYNRLKADGSFTVQKYASGENGPSGNAENLNLEAPGIITILCMQSCKGLEFDSVVIPEIQKYDSSPASDQQNMMNFYVMSSRARERLFYIFSDCDEDPKILKLFPSEKTELLAYQTI